ncbi:ribonuclease HII [Brevundimonas sp. SORGH_AS_0993]|uniref:ribonuclease HII n=1 Tax=Brevundimonas sp. SORGH_AS_0993 TaxID=3041794 RepID=UPI00278464F7|nr:ribonuclease HII [Brevundimonas sp. SORGH_AS_0993]MDQ1152835.1 ribonuclease HII [Brevundimonas sp. SORGH_AS_0993]
MAKSPVPSRAFPTLTLETLLAQRVGGPVCGVDEAGRGPWAGPVSAGAVILNPDDLPPGIDDSKALTEKRRDELAIQIKARAVAWGVGFASVEEIDELNILKATGLAMCRAIEQLAVTPVAALVDGNYRFALPCEVQTAVKGDSLSLSIAAASILAKTARDRLMIELEDRHPGYGFARHKGYNAPAHQAALQSLGPCPAHRRTWAPIRALLAQDG